MFSLLLTDSPYVVINEARAELFRGAFCSIIIIVINVFRLFFLISTVGL